MKQFEVKNPRRFRLPQLMAATILFCLTATVGINNARAVNLPSSGAAAPIECGTTGVTIYDGGGPSNPHSTFRDSYIIIRATGSAQVVLSGRYGLAPNTVVTIYNGEGTSGTVMQTITGTANAYSFLGDPGQTITVRLKEAYSSYTFMGIEFDVSFIGSCSGGGGGNTEVALPKTGAGTPIECGATGVTLTDEGGSTGNYSTFSSGYITLQSSGSATVSLSGTYNVGANASIRIYEGVGVTGSPAQTLTWSGQSFSYTGPPGQAITVQLYSSFSTTTAGFEFQVTYGGTCAQPDPCGAAAINSIPVVNQALVCSGSNNITTGCASGDLYFSGDEAIYSFTPDATGDFEISYSGSTWSGINVFDGCPINGGGGTCVDYIHNSSTSKSLVVNLTANNTYYIVFDDAQISGSNICSGNFSLEAFEAPGYCTAGASNSGNPSWEYIHNVAFNTIDNSSVGNMDGYQNFTGVSTTVSRGWTYNFTATGSPNTFATDRVNVWIDFNQDLDFEDPDEHVLLTSSGTGPWVGSITIPANAPLGETRMRVRLSSAGAPNDTPCGQSGYGQVEDYTVIIEQGVACAAPTVSESRSIDCENDQFALSIDIGSDGNATDYDVSYSLNSGSSVSVTTATGGTSGIAVGTFDIGDDLNVTVAHNGNASCNQTFTDFDQFDDTDGDGIIDECDPCDNNLIGTTCDDGNPNTGNDIYDENCNCVGQPYDCAGIPGGTAYIDDCETCVGGTTGLEPCCPIDVVFSSVPATAGFANGSATVEVSSGSGPYTYFWNDPFMQTTATAIGLFPGTYTCVVTGVDCSLEIDVNVSIQMDIPLTYVIASQCGNTGFALSDFLTAKTLIGADAYRWKFEVQGGAVLGEFTRYNSPHYRLQWVTGIELGTAYNVSVKARKDGQWGEYGDVCMISTASNVPQTELLSAYASLQGETYELCDIIIAQNINSAEDYRWSFDPNTGVQNDEVIYTRNSANPSVRLSWVNNLVPGQLYQVSVMVKVNGVWGMYGVQKPLQVAGVPSNVFIRDSYCGGTYGPNSVILSEGVCEADFYRFRLVPVGGGPAVYRTSNNYVLFFNGALANLAPGDYNLSVRVSQNGQVGDFGPDCLITIGGPTAPIADGAAAQRMIADKGEATLYPNPSTGTEVRVTLIGLTAGTHDVMITVYDLYGKQLNTHGFGHEGETLNRLVRFNQGLSTGVYMVQIVVDGEIHATERLVVN